MIKLPSNVIDRMFAAPEHDLDYLLDRRDVLAMLLKTVPPRHELAVRLFYLTDAPVQRILYILGIELPRLRELVADAVTMMQGAARTCFPHLCVNGGVR